MEIISSQIAKINGLQYEYITPMSIFELLIYLGFNIDTILIDYNGTIITKKNWKKTFLNNLDTLEIITLAGGG